MTDPKAEHFDEIRADRACIGCGFNLYGQTVTKEEHYGLAIARCPECGVVAALQSYPTMSHWVNRFRALLTALWVIVLLGAFIGNTMAFMGMAQGAGNLAGDTMGEIIGQAHAQWSQEQTRIQAQANQAVQTNAAVTVPGLPVGTTIVTTNGVTTINGVVVTPTTPTVPTTTTPGQYRWTWLTAGWAEDHLDQVIEDHGGLLANLDRDFLVMLIPGTIVSVVFGIFWSVALLGSSKRKATIVPIVATLLAILILIGISLPDPNFTYASSLSQGLYAPIVGPVFLFALLVLTLLGVWIGRWVARLVIVLAVPPRSRVPLSILWSRDGLALPKPK